MINSSTILARFLVLICCITSAASGEEGVHFAVGSDRNISKILQLKYLSKSNQALTVGADKCIRLWNVDGWKKLDEFRFHIGRGRIGEINSLSVTKDESKFAIGRFGRTGIAPADILIVQKSPRKILHRLLRHKDTVTQLAFFDNDQKLLSVDESGLLLLWDLKTGSVIGNVSFNSSNERILCVSFNKQDQLALGTSNGNLYLLSASPLKLLKSQKQAHPGKKVKAVFWTTDDQLVSIGDGGNLRLWKWDSRTLTAVREKALGDKSNLTSLSIDKKGKKFYAFFGGNENLAEAGKAEIACRVFGFDLNEKPRLSAFNEKTRLVQSAQFVAARNELIVNLVSSTIEVWDLNTNQMNGSFPNDAKNFYNVKIDQADRNSAEALRLLWRDERNFEVEKNLAPLTHGFNLMNRNLFAPQASQRIQKENYLVNTFSVGKDLNDPKKFYRIQFVNGKLKPPTEGFSIKANRHGTLIREMALVSEDVAVVGTDGGLFLFDPRNGAEIRPLDHQSREIDSISFSLDHRFFATYSAYDRSTAIWSIGKNPKDPILMASLHVVGDEWALVSPEGYFDCTPAAEKFFGWHVNDKENEFATFHELDRFKDKFHTPALFELLWYDRNLSRSLRSLRIVQQSIRQNLGPKISMLRPSESNILQNTPDLIEVEVEFEANGKEVPSAISLLINDRPHDRYYHEVEAGEKKHQFIVKLAQGKQEISAKVYSQSRKSTLASRQIEVDFRPYDSQQKPQGKLFFLGVGIDEFQHYPQLDYCRSDVKDIGEVFATHSKGAFNQEPEISTPTIRSKDQFHQELDKLLGGPDGKNEFKQTDTLVVMWSGHGDVDNENNFHLVMPPCEKPSLRDDGSLRSDGLSALDIAQELRGINGGHIILILDTCYSGKAVEQFRDSAGNLARRTNSDEYGIMVISAAGATETSKENAKLGMSNFAFLLKTGLLGEKIYKVGSSRVTALRSPLVQLDGQDIVTTHSLVEFLKNEMPSLSETQTINTNGFGSRVKFLASK